MELDDESLCHAILRWATKNPQTMSENLQAFVGRCIDFMLEGGSLKRESRDSLDSIVQRFKIDLRKV